MGFSTRDHAPSPDVSAEDLWNAVVENSAAALFVKDREGRYTMINRTCERLWGVSSAEIVGKTDPEVLPAESAAQLMANDRTVFETGTTLEFEERVAFPTGVHTYLVSKTPLFDSEGRCTGLCGVATDITALRASEERLRESEGLLTERSERLSRLHERKDEFLAVLAHELRNPLAPIAYAASVLSTGAPEPGVVFRAASIVQRQAKHLSRLVDDLMDAARLTRRRITLKYAGVDLDEIVARVRESVAADLEASGHRLEVSLPSPPVRLLADADRLVQVLTNLLQNAIRHNRQPGSIWLSADREGDVLQIRVRDDGCGIEQSRLAELFDTFSRAGAPHDTSSGGLGLGLAIVRQVVELHGGEVAAYSGGPGQGSEFVVKLPCASEAVEAKGRKTGASPRSGTPRRLLVVDDNEDAAELLAMRLRGDGHDVEVCNRATEVEGRVARRIPDVVLLDLGMPEMDGYQVAEQLRVSHPGVRLFALTGYGQEADRIRTKQCGFELHLVKPVAYERLSEALG